MTSTVAPPATPRAQIDALQILRAAAAMAVFLFHYFDAIFTDFGLFGGNIFTAGAFGVDVFFVVSGFIICFAAKNEASPIRFLIKRLCRILPLYYLLTFGIFAIVLFAPSLLNSTTATPETLIKSLLFVPYEKANGLVQPMLFLGWTLNYEMFFYLIFTVAMLSGKHTVSICIALICALVTVGHIVQPQGVIAKFFTSGIMLNFVWGCGAYLIYTHAPGVMNFARKIWPLAVIALLALNFMDTSVPREFDAGLPSALLLLGVLPLKVPTGRVWSFLTRLGDASYSLYLVHPYFLQVCIKVALPIMGVSALSVSIATIAIFGSTIIASLLLFKLVERPSNIWLRKRLLPKPQVA